MAKTSRILLPVLLPLAPLLVSSIPLLGLQYPQGHDWIFELVRVAEYKLAILGGQYPPYWSENLYSGYGSPIFLFYAPLYLIVSTLFSFMSGSITTGSIFSILLFSLIATYSTQSCIKALFKIDKPIVDSASRIAVYFFILNPYLIGDKLLRNANAEYSALCLSPLVLCGLFTIERRPVRGALMLAAGLALIIIAHNLTALIIFGLISGAALVLYLPHTKMSPVLRSLVSILLGLGMSSFFWIPALSYKNLVHIDQLVVGKFDFHRQFQPFTSFFAYDQFFSVGILTPLVLLSSAYFLSRAYCKHEWEERRPASFLGITSLLFIFLQTSASTPVWSAVPWLPLFQFPWRMMGPLALCTSLLAGLTFSYIFEGKSKRAVAIAEAFVLAICIGNAIPALYASKPIPEHLSARMADILRPDSISNNMLSATVLDEYLPRSADPEILRVDGHKEPLFQSSPSVTISVKRNTGTHIILLASGPEPSSLEIARWFFPGWVCAVDGKSTEIRASQHGLLEILVPAGIHEVEILMKPPLLRRVGILISVVTLLLLCGLLLFLALKPHRK